MSHFTVLVIGPDHEAQLQPFHEFECTGIADQYVQDIDETAEKREEFATETRTVVKMPSGRVVSSYDDEFYRATRPGEESSGGRYGKVRDLMGLAPYEEKFDSVEDWADYHGHKIVRDEEPDIAGEHKYGYVRVFAGEIVKAIRRTNPNKQWDWWVVGGRWSGFFKLKAGAEGQRGERGLMGSSRSEAPDRADITIKGAIDFDGMRSIAGADAAANWEKARAALVAAGAPLIWRTWEQCRDEDHKVNITAARDAYHAQASVVALKASDFHDADQFLAPFEVYTQAARDSACVPYAVVHKGEWASRGEMGWFGMSSGDMDKSQWARLVNDLLDSLPDDTPLTLVDCHI